jgi:hypothetical protein
MFRVGWGRRVPTRAAIVGMAFALMQFGPVPSHAADPLYGPHVSHPVGAQPRSVAALDADGDGVLDLVSANFGDGTVSVLRGVGGGAFAPATTIAAGPSPTTVSVGDLNHDNDPDLAVTSAPTVPGTAAVLVLLGASGASFAAPVGHPLEQNALGGAVADVDGDGHLDVVAVDPFGVSVLLGAGDGSLGLAARQPVGTFLASVSTGDFNGDNDPDLALGQFVGQALVLLGGPGASFGPPTGLTAGFAPDFPAVGDVNGDGHLDLAVSDFSSSNVFVLLGAGNGTFAAATAYDTGVVNGMATHAAIARLDGDGRADIVVTNNSTNNVSVLINGGSGSFGPATTHAVGTGPFALAVGEFNNDGGGDLAVTDAGSADVATLLSILPNHPPDCSAVRVNPNRLWPPNHGFRNVRVDGATDQDGDELVMAITGVTQDEPVESFFGLEITPDAYLGSHPGDVRLRAERDSGNGRVYRISFTVTDTHSASCTGLVTVGVPRSAHSTTVDSGATYNSLEPGARPSWWWRVFGRRK